MGLKLLPRAFQDDPSELQGAAQTSQKHEKPVENQCFHDIHKITLGHPWAPRFAPQVLQMRPQIAQKRPKGLKMSQFMIPSSAIFCIETSKNECLVSGTPPKDAQDLQNAPKRDPGHLNINNINHILEVFG